MSRKADVFRFGSLMLLLTLMVMFSLSSQYAQALQPTAEPTSEATPVPTSAPTRAATEAPTERADLLKPDDKVGEIMVTVASASEIPTDFPALVGFCNVNDGQPLATPGKYTGVCDVPAFAELVIGPRWLTGDRRIAPSWSLMDWELYFEDKGIDLSLFDTYDYEIELQNSASGQTSLGRVRLWSVILRNLKPGRYTVRVIQKVSEPVTGAYVYDNRASFNLANPIPAGTYEITYTVNIGKQFYANPCPAIPAVATSDAAATLAPTAASTPGGRVRQGFLGIRYTLAPCGALVREVSPDTPAADAGLEVDDVILAVNGIEIVDSEQLRQIVQGAGAGSTVTLTIARGEKVSNVQVTLAERPPDN